MPLGLVKIAGALGLLAGIAYRPLGIAAATGVVLYFLGAVMTHVRGGDKKGSATPAVIMLLAVAPLVLGVATV
ncbi:DoxX family protein [Streptomyces canus]|uniref:DoxX family protein n=1 Tax=Streptomyces canus TaxID=58343 RepID=UPI003248B448|nr:DoxX family protein [Streptomyces sp. NBC_00882]